MEVQVHNQIGYFLNRFGNVVPAQIGQAIKLPPFPLPLCSYAQNLGIDARNVRYQVKELSQIVVITEVIVKQQLSAALTVAPLIRAQLRFFTVTIGLPILQGRSPRSP